jgi:hypothetical protein
VSSSRREAFRSDDNFTIGDWDDIRLFHFPEGEPTSLPSTTPDKTTIFLIPNMILVRAIPMMSKTEVTMSKSSDRQLRSGFDREVTLRVGPNGAKNRR